MPEKLTLILSAGIAALGWLITHYVDRLNASATVEYSSYVENCDGIATLPATACNYRVEVTNLNRTTSFNNLVFNFLAKGEGQISSYAFRPIEPAHVGNEPPRVGPRSAEFIATKLMPDAAIEIILRATGGPPTMHVQADDTIRMSPPTLETFLARYEMILMTALIVSWIGLILVLTFKSAPPAVTGTAYDRHVLLFEDPEPIGNPAPKT